MTGTLAPANSSVRMQTSFMNADGHFNGQQNSPSVPPQGFSQAAII
jgi:hypothetical protein